MLCLFHIIGVSGPNFYFVTTELKVELQLFQYQQSIFYILFWLLESHGFRVFFAFN